MSLEKYNLLIVYQECIEFPDILLSETSLGVSIQACKSNDLNYIQNISKKIDICLLWCWEGAEQIFEILKGKENISWIHTIWTGLDKLDFKNCHKNLKLTNSKGVSSRSLAEFALASSLYFYKNIKTLGKNKNSKQWVPTLNENLLDKKLGILGYGSIGREVENIFEPLCSQILVFSKSKLDLNKPKLIQNTLTYIFKNSDILVSCLPLTKETRKIINMSHLRELNANAIFINISRGKVVEEEDLVDILKNNKIRGAALDVFETEPLPQGHPLWDLENVIISPHSADKSQDRYLSYLNLYLENLEKFLSKEALDNLVNFDKGY